MHFYEKKMFWREKVEIRPCKKCGNRRLINFSNYSFNTENIKNKIVNVIVSCSHQIDSKSSNLFFNVL